MSIEFRFTQLAAAFRERVFTDLLACNGAADGLALFDALPSSTHNCRPDLLGREFVKRAYRTWMEWAVWAGIASWQGLRQEVAERWGRDRRPLRMEGAVVAR